MTKNEKLKKASLFLSNPKVYTCSIKKELIENEDYAAITELTKLHLDKIEEATTVK